ncbi:hypothetical protein [Jiangella muralis]|uniref:hypothetical protein n=1 Tax=Jiangella muralis TaxID=702383 RepID=UPI00069D23D6|nr:hypothetical protein [Jiangella muralis]
MTWAKIDDRFNDDPDLLRLPRGVRLLHVEGIVWSCRHETDGEIPGHMLGKVTDEPDAGSAVERLVAAGLWMETGDGWRIANFTRDQRSKADVERDREFWRQSKVRTRRHKAGDHSLCTNPRYCNHVSTRTPGGNLAENPPEDSRLPVPSRPDPTTREGRGREGGSPSDSAPAGASAARPPAVERIDIGRVPDYSRFKIGEVTIVDEREGKST